MKNKAKLFVCIFMLFCFVLSATNKIKVGWPLIQGLQEYDENSNSYSGFNYDYLKEIAKYNNFDYEFYVGSMKECKKWLKEGKIDILGPFVESFATNPNFSVCGSPFGSLPRVWISKEESPFWFEDFSAFNEKKIGILNKEYEKKVGKTFAKNNYVELDEFFYENNEDLIKALDSGEIDIAQVDSFFDCSNYKIISTFNSDSLYFMAKNENSKVIEAFVYAIKLINQQEPEFENSLYNKHFNGNEEEIKIHFSDAEIDFLSSKPVIKVLYTQHFYPLIFTDENGDCSGFLRLYMDLISQKTGIKFVYSFFNSSFEEAKKILDDGFDLFLTKENTLDEDFTKSFEATIPFFQIQYGGFINSNEDSSLQCIGLAKKNKDKKSIIEKDGYEVVIFSDEKEAIKALEEGKIDGYFDTIYSLSSYNIENLKIENVEYRNYENLFDSLSIYVDKNLNPLLLSSLNKAIESISKKDVDVLLFKSTSSFRNLSFTDFLRKNIWAVLAIVLLFAVTVSIIIILEFSWKKEKNITKNLKRVILDFIKQKKFLLKLMKKKQKSFKLLAMILEHQ